MGFDPVMPDRSRIEGQARSCGKSRRFRLSIPILSSCPRFRRLTSAMTTGKTPGSVRCPSRRSASSGPGRPRSVRRGTFSSARGSTSAHNHRKFPGFFLNLLATCLLFRLQGSRHQPEDAIGEQDWPRYLYLSRPARLPGYARNQRPNRQLPMPHTYKWCSNAGRAPENPRRLASLGAGYRGMAGGASRVQSAPADS